MSVFAAIRKTIGTLPPESGGLLAGSRKTGVITFFYFDDLANCSSVGYSPDTVTLNLLLTRLNAEGIDMLGFVHSHPAGLHQPSGGDIYYCRKIFAANPGMPFLVIPIVNSSATGTPFRMRVFVATPNGGEVAIWRMPLNAGGMEKIIPEIKLPEIATEELVA
jgi:proteasome lid subunit RPN8/RPN11